MIELVKLSTTVKMTPLFLTPPLKHVHWLKGGLWKQIPWVNNIEQINSSHYDLISESA